MAKVEIKKPIVDEIKELLKDAQAAVIVDYRGLTVEEDTKLRNSLRKEGVTYKVYKNTMIRFAIEGTEFEALGKHLEGPTALAVSKEDATAPARILFNFSKEAKALELKAGEEFKVRQGASWDVNFGVEFNGANIVVEADGKYQVQLVWDGAQGGTVTLIPAA